MLPAPTETNRSACGAGQGRRIVRSRSESASGLFHEAKISPKQRAFGMQLQFAGGVSVFTSHGMMTSLKILGSGHTPTCRPRCAPFGLIHASLGTSPLLSNK